MHPVPNDVSKMLGVPQSIAAPMPTGAVLYVTERERKRHNITS